MKTISLDFFSEFKKIILVDHMILPRTKSSFELKEFSVCETWAEDIPT